MVKEETQNGAGINTCKKCGVPLEPDTKFCVNCGAPIEDVPKEPAPEPHYETAVQESLNQEEEKVEEQVQEQEQIQEPALEVEQEQPIVPAEPVLMSPVEPVYQAESYAPTTDMPFPEAPEAPEAVGYRQAPKRTGVFSNAILGFVVMLVLLLGAFAAGLLNYNFMSQVNLQVVFVQILLYGGIAFAAVITSRAKGPDISVGAVMALAAVLTVSITGSWIIGLVLAVLVCAAIGAVNGLFIVYLRVPSLLITIAMASLIRGIVYTVSNGYTMQAGRDIEMLARFNIGGLPIIPLAVFVFAFILVFLLVILSRLGKPLSKREASDDKCVSYFLAYLFSSVIACLIGVLMLSRLGTATPNIGFGNELFIIFIFAAITSSRFLDNRVVPVFYAIIATVLYVVIQNVLLLYGLTAFLQQIITAVITIGFIAVSYIARKDSFKGLIQRI